MIFVQPGRRGFYSVILWYLSHCHIAELNEDDVMIPRFSELYYIPKKVDSYIETSPGFLQFFEDPLLIVDKSLKYPQKFENIKNLEMFRDFDGQKICGFIFDVEVKKYMNYLIKKYLKIKPHIKEKIDNYSKIFDSKKVLGTHGLLYINFSTDKIVNLEKYLNKIDENIRDYDLIYVMSDSMNSIEELSKRYENVFYVEDILRTKDYKDEHLIYGKHSPEIKYKLGGDILVETEILSRCDKILVTNSNISSYALVNNPYIKYEYMDLNIKSE